MLKARCYRPLLCWNSGRNKVSVWVGQNLLRQNPDKAMIQNVDKLPAILASLIKKQRVISA